MQKLSQRMALVCGGLCLGAGLLLVLLSHLSGSYILRQQQDQHMQALTGQLARQLSGVVAQNDLIRLEATLNGLQQRHELQRVRVTDLAGQPLGEAGAAPTRDSRSYTAALTIGDNVAGEVTISTLPSMALQEHQRLALGLLFMAILASLFAAALAGRWGQGAAARLSALQSKLSREPAVAGDEISALETAVNALPLQLIMPADNNRRYTPDFELAGLLYIHLASLTRYVETLDEQSLLNYTDSLRELFEQVARLYEGRVTVAREFGVLMSFSGDSTAGSAGFRALSSAWLLRRLCTELSTDHALRYRLGLSCGLGEGGRQRDIDSPGDSLYPDLYNQHIIDDLAGRAAHAAEAITVSAELAGVEDIQARCHLRESGQGSELDSFAEPWTDLLERQFRLLLGELKRKT